MTVIAIVAAIALVTSLFAIMKRNFLFAIGASVAWFFLIAYTRINPIYGIAAGSSVDSLFIGICMAFSLGTILSIFVLNVNDEKKNNPPPDEREVNRHNARGSSYESAEDYQARLQSVSRRKRK